MTKRELIGALAQVGDNEQVQIGVMYMYDSWGNGAFYDIDDVQVTDDSAAICCTVVAKDIP